MYFLRFCITLIFVLFVNSASCSEYDTFYKQFFKNNNTEFSQMFSSSFLKAVPEKQLLKIVDLYSSQLGDYIGCQKHGKKISIKFQEGVATSTISFDNKGKVVGLWFGNPVVKADNMGKIIEEFKKLSAQVGICILKDGNNIVLDYQSKEPFACGSSFKLFLLEALINRVKEGKFSWSDIVNLKQEWKSFPSGILQDWPDKSPVTLYSLAALMISISDNTATDHIYNLLGKDLVKEYLPDSCSEFLTTCELLKLKFGFPKKAHEFVSASKADKRKILAFISNISLETIDLSYIMKPDFKPVLINKLEWFISPLDLCKVIYRLRDSMLLRINPARGIVQKHRWYAVCYKGGSEPGVLNYTWALKKEKNSAWYSISCTINNTDKRVETQKFTSLVKRLLKLVENGTI